MFWVLEVTFKHAKQAQKRIRLHVQETEMLNPKPV